MSEKIHQFSAEPQNNLGSNLLLAAGATLLIDSIRRTDKILAQKPAHREPVLYLDDPSYKRCDEHYSLPPATFVAAVESIVGAGFLMLAGHLKTALPNAKNLDNPASNFPPIVDPAAWPGYFPTRHW